jgi:hypothetical protein
LSGLLAQRLLDSLPPAPSGAHAAPSSWPRASCSTWSKVGRRPVSYDAAEHKQHNAVERFFNQRKNWRGLASRYIKHTLDYRGGAVPGAVQDSGCGELRNASFAWALTGSGTAAKPEQGPGCHAGAESICRRTRLTTPPAMASPDQLRGRLTQ